MDYSEISPHCKRGTYVTLVFSLAKLVALVLVPPLSLCAPYSTTQLWAGTGWGPNRSTWCLGTGLKTLMPELLQWYRHNHLFRPFEPGVSNLQLQ